MRPGTTRGIFDGFCLVYWLEIFLKDLILDYSRRDNVAVGVYYYISSRQPDNLISFCPLCGVVGLARDA